MVGVLLIIELNERNVDSIQMILSIQVLRYHLLEMDKVGQWAIMRPDHLWRDNDPSGAALACSLRLRWVLPRK